jgi:hypothetical protein
MQSKTFAAIETFVNVLVGWVIAMLLNGSVFPMFGINIPMDVNLKVSVIFTIVAIIRGYSLRRFFNYLAMRNLVKGISHNENN